MYTGFSHVSMCFFHVLSIIFPTCPYMSLHVPYISHHFPIIPLHFPMFSAGFPSFFSWLQGIETRSFQALRRLRRRLFGRLDGGVTRLVAEQRVLAKVIASHRGDHGNTICLWRKYYIYVDIYIYM